MAEILSGYGPDSHQPQQPRASNGGVKSSKPLAYSPPVGPSGLGHSGPGLGGDNHGHGTKGTGEHMSGKPGLGGAVHPYGSQRCD